MLNIKSETPRLQLALMDEGDAELLFELDQDPEVMRFITGGKCTTREEIEQVFLPRMKSYRRPDKGWGLWKVIVKDSQTFIGWVLVRPMNFFNDNTDYKDLELGWRFKCDAWGKGYATEAAKGVMQLLKEDGECDFFSAIADEQNLASIAIMKKLGMKFIDKSLHKDPLGDLEAVHYQVSVQSINSLCKT